MKRIIRASSRKSYYPDEKLLVNVDSSFDTDSSMSDDMKWTILDSVNSWLANRYREFAGSDVTLSSDGNGNVRVDVDFDSIARHYIEEQRKDLLSSLRQRAKYIAKKDSVNEPNVHVNNLL